MISDDQHPDDDKFKTLFEGERSSLLTTFREPPENRSKIADKKQENAQTKKSFKTPERERGNRRLPPGQSSSTEWPVLDLGDKPVIAPEDWSLSVAGLVEQPITWDWQTFIDQPQSAITTDIHCVTAWSRFDNVWTGVSARHLLSVVNPKPEAKFLMFHGYDGYTTNVPLERFNADDAIIAQQWQGAPITREHGGPVRVVIPSLYFWKSAKWLRHIVFLDRDIQGYWETRGYHNDGDPWKEQRYE